MCCSVGRVELSWICRVEFGFVDITGQVPCMDPCSIFRGICPETRKTGLGASMIGLDCVVVGNLAMWLLEDGDK